MRSAAALNKWGCNLAHMGLQPLSHGVAASSTYGCRCPEQLLLSFESKARHSKYGKYSLATYYVPTYCVLTHYVLTCYVLTYSVLTMLKTQLAAHLLCTYRVLTVCPHNAIAMQSPNRHALTVHAL